MTDSDQAFSRDVKRTVLLGTYIAHWGMPKTRRIISGSGSRIELYGFTASPESGGVDRLVTIGVSDAFNQIAGESGIELLFAWLPDSTRASYESLEDLVFDSAVYFQDSRKRDLGAIIALERKPASMTATKLMLDEPLAEKKSLAAVSLGAAHVHVLWLVPLFEDEVDFINTHDFQVFDTLRQNSTQSLFRLDRVSMVASDKP